MKVDRLNQCPLSQNDKYIMCYIDADPTDDLSKSNKTIALLNILPFRFKPPSKLLKAALLFCSLSILSSESIADEINFHPHFLPNIIWAAADQVPMPQRRPDYFGGSSQEQYERSIETDKFAAYDLPETANGFIDKQIKGSIAKLDALQNAKSAIEARQLEREIWIEWTKIGSHTSQLLLKRAKILTDLGKFEAALDLLDQVIKIDPEFVEGWNKRATLLFYTKRYQESLADISMTLSLEPRHFGALTGMANILEKLDHTHMALKVYQEAVKLNPHLIGGKNAIERLTRKLKNSEI